jgi:hypothetical protein
MTCRRWLARGCHKETHLSLRKWPRLGRGFPGAPVFTCRSKCQHLPHLFWGIPATRDLPLQVGL